MAKHKNLFLPEWINGKFLFMTFVVMIFSHLIIFMIYSNRNSSFEFKINRDIIARQIINFIQTIENTPVEEQQKLIKALDLPHFKVSLDEKPKWSEQFVNASLWQILKKISEQSPEISLSFMLAPSRWLNIQADIIQTTWGLQSLLLILEFTVIMAILFSLWTMKRFTQPFKTITARAGRLGIDLNTEPLPIYGPRVAKITAKAMNKMQERIRDLVEARTKMLAAISHDLRTPITRLKLRAQYIDDDSQYHKMIKDLDEMDAMITETLAFAREDNKKEKRVNIDLESLLSTLCDNFADVGHDVVYHSTGQRLPIFGGAVALKRVFSNLITNAIKYAGKAEVSVETNEEEITIYIDDEGPGLPEDQLEQVFQPFFRAESSRSRETGGTGLGLAVARDIIQAHGGRIRLQVRQPKGLRAKVVLPRLESIKA